MPFAVVIAAAVLLACLVHVRARNIHEQHFAAHAYKYDAVSYRLEAYAGYEARQAGMLAGIRHAWSNPRHFLDLAFLHVISP